MKVGTLLVLILLYVPNSYGLEYVARVIPQKDVPISIINYDAEYEAGNKYQVGGIKHSIKYKNTGKQRIEAIQFSFISFDVWNEFLDKTNGLSLSPNDSGDNEKGMWIAHDLAEFSFLTGFAYVSRIRYADGTIWNADQKQIRQELHKIKSDFDVDALISKPDKGKQ
jgi:hypothetical protein